MPTTIDVVTVDPGQDPDGEDSPFNATSRVSPRIRTALTDPRFVQDEHGQSMLHFAAARTHARNALFQLMQETEIDVGYRDALYRTARDISIQANIPENTMEIDRYVIHIACKG